MQGANDFPQIGEAFVAETDDVSSAQIGEGTALLMPQRALVDYAVQWMETHRSEGETDTKAPLLTNSHE